MESLIPETIVLLFFVSMLTKRHKEQLQFYVVFDQNQNIIRKMAKTDTLWTRQSRLNTISILRASWLNLVTKTVAC